MTDKCENCLSKSVCRWYENGDGKNLCCADDFPCPEQKDKDRYIKVPCKVGDTVYCLIQGFDNPLKASVKKIVIQESGVVISCSVLGYFGQSYMATDFGETVFLTKEGAEEKLKELNK